ncbi:MAG: 5-methyltetrahydrofolate--homocysteine methyltransferase [Eubacterium sp.]
MECYYKDLPVHMDQGKIFLQMHIRKDLWNYEEYEKAYLELENELPKLLEPQGIYKLTENKIGGTVHKDLEKTSHLVCTMVTLGSKVSERCTEYFMEKDYLKGLMIDSIADQMLFDLSNDFYKVIKKDVVDEQKFGLTVRYSPDDCFIPIHFQKDILEIVEGNRYLSVGITEGFMYNPIKTLGYLYGADQKICTSLIDHDCSLCSNTKCTLRKIA